MNKEKLIAARKRLKEYQRSKKEQPQENHLNQQNNAQTENVLDNVQNSENVPVNETHYPDFNMAHQQNLNTIENSFTVPNSSGNAIENLFTDPNYPHDNTENAIPDPNVYNIPPSHFQNSHPQSTMDNSHPQSTMMFEVTDCQNANNQVVFTQTNHEQPVQEQFREHPENSVRTCSAPLNSMQHDGDVQATFESIKDSFAMQKEQMLQMSSTIQDVLKNKCEEVIDQDGMSRVIDESRILVDHLQKEVSQYKNRVQELENTLRNKDAEFHERLSREVNPLHEQLQIHAHTTNILVAEKAELTSKLQQYEAANQQKTDEVKDLLDKLKASQHRVTKLEKDLLFIRSNNNDVQKACQQLQNRYDELANNFSELRKSKDDLELEASELNQKLSVKNNDILNLQQELQEKVALLSLSDLKIQQLTSSPEDTQNIDNQRNAVAGYEKQIAQLKETIRGLTDEKSDAGKQYTSYVQQLDERLAQLTQELETANKRISEFESREESFIQRLSDMEQQLQKEKEKVESMTMSEDHQARINILTKNIDHLVMEQESLQTTLNNKNLEIEQLKLQLQEFQEPNEPQVDTSKLLSALESEQQGAARAVSQNQQLKNQLVEMHDAFVSLSNDKLELTEQLQAERNIGKKMNVMLNDVESQLEELKEKLAEKEAALLEFEKEKLRSAQIEDQIYHYQAQSHHASTLQQELTNALAQIEMLKKDNQRLNEQINIRSRTMINMEESSENPVVKSDEIPSETIEISPANTRRNGTRKISTETQTSQGEEDESFNIPEPLKKLEAKFKQTMEQVADLTDEKQRLEHLVMQLQGETETIGEYIALYQKQRSFLHERAREKEKTYKALLEQRNQLQEQLHKLKLLVSELIQEKMKHSQENAQNSVANNNKTDDVQNESNTENTPEIDIKEPKVIEILDLLTEIKDCNNTCNLDPDFHPCLCCSGKLITV